MKTVKSLVILILALFLMQPMFAQNSNRKVVATRIKTDNLSYEEQDFLRDINTYLHSAFEKNGYALVSIENEDRETANMLERLNYIDANVRGMNGEAIDYIFTIWIEKYNGNYKVCSKRVGRINTDFKEGIVVEKNGGLIDKKFIRNLVALEILRQYVVLSSSNQSNYSKLIKEEANIIHAIREKDNIDKIKRWLAPTALHVQNGHIGSGIVLCAGELVSVGGIIYTHIEAGKIVRKLKDDDWSRKRNDGNAMSDAERQRISDKHHKFQTINLCCWGCAALFYAINVGTSYKIVNQKYSVSPIVMKMDDTDNYAYGITLSYKF